MEWAAGGVFVTPPGWWHSHHNDSTEDAWVLPLQVRASSAWPSGLSFLPSPDLSFPPPSLLRMPGSTLT